MIQLRPTNQQIERAKKLFDFKELNGSITNGEGNIPGAMGEVLIADHYGVDHSNTYDYDLIIKDKKVDVKTKSYKAGLNPRREWTLNVASFNSTQSCDYYCFVGLASDFGVGFLYGFISSDRFHDVAIFGKAGEEDVFNPGFTYRGDCYNIRIKDLSPPKPC
jgi:hypothetical protein